MSPEELLSLERERQEIDWKLISDAVSFYKDKGYTYTEVPWLVSNEATKITYQGPITYSTQVGNLVGSAEQSLLELEINNLLPEANKLVTVSPCWRDEPEYDDWHHTSFMKVELFSRDDIWKEFLHDARDNFNSLFGYTDVIKCPDGPYTEQYDIFVTVPGGERVELGSYGYRKHNSLVWSYGTGLAEPRTSSLLKLIT